jgi:hypothetical protein
MDVYIEQDVKVTNQYSYHNQNFKLFLLLKIFFVVIQDEEQYITNPNDTILLDYNSILLNSASSQQTRQQCY